MLRYENWPLSKELVERELIIAQGTITGHKIIRYQSIFNIAGGTHHAYSTHGEAFVYLMTKPLQLSFY
jgi:acetoin utilization deacetylase AcuC-like enzyme